MPLRDTPRRPPLTRERVVRAAVDVADRDGLGALTMRRLGSELGVEAMAIYKHVAGKEEILDAMVELVTGEIEVPDGEADWRQAMRRRAISARQVLRGHPWAIGLLETRGAMGPATMRYADAILGSLRSAGFSVENAAHAFWLLDSYLYGHVVQETSLSSGPSDEGLGSGRSIPAEGTIDGYPHLAEVWEHAVNSGYSVDDEFEFGLELILDALGKHRGRRRRT